jgi:hypothetical protein
VIFVAENFELEDFNMVDMQAKKVLVALSEFERGIMVKGEEIHIKTGLIPSQINDAVRSLATSLLVNIPDAMGKIAPYDFYAVEITDFGRQVLEQFG